MLARLGLRHPFDGTPDERAAATRAEASRLAAALQTSSRPRGATMLATEADVVRSLRDGTYTLDELYARCARQADIARDDGGRPPTDTHPTDTVWKRRVRGALQALKAAGRATRVERGVWALRGTRERPDRLMLILPGGALADFQLRLQTAVALLGELDEPADLV